MIRLVLFDIDGTLIQSGDAGEKAFARVCAQEFKVANGTERLHFAGRTDPSIVREFFQRHGIEPSPRNFERFFDSYVFWLDHLLGETKGRVLPGVSHMVSTLGSLRKPPVLGLLTGNVRLGAQIKLGHYQLWSKFQIGAFGDDHEDRNEIAAIARRRGGEFLGTELAGEQILVIGDTPLDIACAKAIGAKALAVATGSYSLAQLREHAPNWAVSDLEGVCIHEVASA